MEGNRIRTVENVAKLISLEGFFLSGNPIADLDDLKELSSLPVLKRVAFACENFEAAPVSEIGGYRNFVLSTCGSPYLEVVDSETLGGEERSAARNEYMQRMMELQSAMDEIEKEHRHTVLRMDAKVKENEEHMEKIQDNLIEELHALRTDIEHGRGKVLGEYEQLKRIR